MKKLETNPPPGKICVLLTRRPTGPLNYLTRLQHLQEVGLLPAFKPGEVWLTHVHHEPECPLLAGLATCLCNSTLRFERVAAGGLGPCAVATEHVEGVAAR